MFLEATIGLVLLAVFIGGSVRYVRWSDAQLRDDHDPTLMPDWWLKEKEFSRRRA